MADEATLEGLKELLGYTDEQWETWKSNPRNLQVAENLDGFEKYKMVAEVTSSHGCAVGHKVGDRIVYSGGGALLCKENPDMVCFGLLGPVNSIVPGVFDAICRGDDPTKLAFNKVHCVDVGVDEGGWGAVVAEIKVEKV